MNNTTEHCIRNGLRLRCPLPNILRIPRTKAKSQALLPEPSCIVALTFGPMHTAKLYIRSPRWPYDVAICATPHIAFSCPFHRSIPDVLFSEDTSNTGERRRRASPPAFNDDLDDGGRIWHERTTPGRDTFRWERQIGLSPLLPAG